MSLNPTIVSAGVGPLQAAQRKRQAEQQRSQT
jgi:hypothetical protein